MERYIVAGGNPLSGTLAVQGAKNSALPIIAACILSPGRTVLHNVPQLTDIDVMLEILRTVGAKVVWQDQSTLSIDSSSLDNWRIPESLMRRMRSSFFVVGPLLSRFGQVRVTYPGGCAIGTRSIDLHLKGLEKLGVEIKPTQSGHIDFRGDNLRGASIDLDIPSVGATENIMMAAVTAQGTTVIRNPAREPEIVDLGNYLQKLGAQISGAGTDKIVIQGVTQLGESNHTIIPDRIVAGTLILAAAITGGEIVLTNVIPGHLSAVIAKLAEMGVSVDAGSDTLRVVAQDGLNPVDKIITAPYPGFPTDMQAQFMAALASARGVSVIVEKIFDGRFKHVNELRRMGANISVDERTAIVRGVDSLSGASVEASDLRAGAALVLAALGSKGITTVNGVWHIDRGYVALEKQLSSLGAKITREKGD